MDTFVPPGWMTRTELVERTGKAFKDSWLGAMPTTAEILKANPELQDMLVPRNAIRMARAGYPAGWAERVLSQRLAKRLAELRAEEPEKAEMHDRVIEAIREPLCSSVFGAGIKISSGEIHGLPPHFWRGDRAIPAFDTGAATHGREVQTSMGPVLKGAVTGLLLFERGGAEAWLASRGAAPAEANSRIPSVAELSEFLSGIADGVKTEGQCRDAAEGHFGMKIPDTRSLWRAAWRKVPDEKKLGQGGKPKR